MSTPQDPPARDYGREAQVAAEAHVAACFDAYYANEELEDGQPEVGGPESAPFDGCDTCQVREALFAAWPLLRLAALDGAE